MQFVADTLDDLLQAVLGKLLRVRSNVSATKGKNVEITGAALELRRPRARLSRSETKGTIFSCLGETLWYLSRKNDVSFIQYYISDYGKYSDDGKTVYGGYGPRLFGSSDTPNQIGYITRVLKLRPNTRKAVVQLFDRTDVVEDHQDVPCTCILQFFIRSGRLDLIVYMRSNDAFRGLPHDVFAFTFIQELVARSLAVDVGRYKHFVGSLHLYDCDRVKAQKFLSEGWQSTSLMQPMPGGDQWANVQRVLELEPRAHYEADLDLSSLPNYWADIVRLLQVYAQTGKKRPIAKLKAAMSSRAYDAYVDKRAAMRPKKKEATR